MLAQTKNSVAPHRTPEFPLDRIRDLSERVYRDRLGENDVASMIAKDGDGGIKLRERAVSYDALSRAYLRAIEGGA